jgi:hypothetical protein
MVSLESTTKRHYMFPYDPDYVAVMSEPGFDEHLDLATFARAVTKEQVEAYKNGDETIKPIRKRFKATNYSAVYGVGAPKLARELGIKEKEAKKLLDAYWERNWSVKKVAESQEVRVIGGEMWLKNPVSGFYHLLRYKKDVFSTLNQSTGVYCFDTWVAYVRSRGVQVVAQFHDEIVLVEKDGLNTDHVVEQLNQAIEKTNQKLKLNVPLGIDVKVGKCYAEVH